MEDLFYVGKIAAIIAALIALRLIIQRVAKNDKVSKPAGSLFTFLLPPLVTGGPLFIAIPASLYAIKNPEVPSLLVYMAFAGGVGLSIALATMFVMLQRQKVELERLGKLFPPEDGEKA